MRAELPAVVPALRSLRPFRTALGRTAKRRTVAIVTTFVASATTFETISGASWSAIPYDSHSMKPTSSTPR